MHQFKSAWHYEEVGQAYRFVWKQLFLQLYSRLIDLRASKHSCAMLNEWRKILLSPEEQRQLAEITTDPVENELCSPHPQMRANGKWPDVYGGWGWWWVCVCVCVLGLQAELSAVQHYKAVKRLRALVLVLCNEQVLAAARAAVVHLSEKIRLSHGVFLRGKEALLKV